MTLLALDRPLLPLLKEEPSKPRDLAGRRIEPTDPNVSCDAAARKTERKDPCEGVL